MELATEIYKRMRTVKDVTRKDVIEKFIAEVKLTKAGASTYFQLIKDKQEPMGKKWRLFGRVVQRKAPTGAFRFAACPESNQMSAVGALFKLSSDPALNVAVLTVSNVMSVVVKCLIKILRRREV